MIRSHVLINLTIICVPIEVFVRIGLLKNDISGVFFIGGNVNEPNYLGTQIKEVHFIMAKLTREQKIEIYKKRKDGCTISSLSNEYQINIHNIKYLIKLIDRHGFNILRNDKNNYYSPKLKLEIINKVLLDNQSMESTAIEYGLSSIGILSN